MSNQEDRIDWRNVHNVVLVRCMIMKFSPSSLAEALGVTRNVFAGYFNRISFQVPEAARRASSYEIKQYAESIGIKLFALVKINGEFASTFPVPWGAELVANEAPFAHLMAPDLGPRPERPKGEKRVRAKGARRVRPAPAPDSTSAPETVAASVVRNESTFGSASATVDQPYVPKRKALPKEESKVLPECVMPAHVVPEGDAYEALPYPRPSNDNGDEKTPALKILWTLFPSAKTIFNLDVKSCRTPLWAFSLRDKDGRNVPLSQARREKMNEYKILYKVEQYDPVGPKYYCGAPVDITDSYCETCMRLLGITPEQVKAQRNAEKINREAVRHQALKKRSGKYNS